MLVGKARSLPKNGALERRFTAGLACKHYTRIEGPTGDSSLLRFFWSSATTLIVMTLGVMTLGIIIGRVNLSKNGSQDNDIQYRSTQHNNN